ncbi:hypothetical protein Xen7305DRAFT_00037640 [Xenococcus sp. PCC 7305]|uniref:hypothetical protein n=1 Tax=Xenococcus sp. PCC 7305 TaxID=102125 RepID=UPI0002ABE96E|nr:hypothetical protein [Xenococcus sp. PCC 7305]ELS04036.1 hypothetical protein Xen7305DRAFT_00037640 [Xenococcus sp. PCC 7305]
MTIDKTSHQKSQIREANDNPLANIAGQFGGKFWLETQLEIERSRKIDKEETSKLLESKSNEQD